MKPTCYHGEDKVCKSSDSYDINLHCKLCYLWDFEDAFNRAFGGPGLNNIKYIKDPPCIHLGKELKLVKCDTCAGNVNIKVFECTEFKECSIGKKIATVDGCCNDNGVKCSKYVADDYKLIAPYNTSDVPNKWEGRCTKKPNSYKVSVAIPHLNTIKPLKVLIELLRLQTEKPYIMVIDTGSPKEIVPQLEELRDYDLEIHYIRGHSYIHSSGAVTVANDVAGALCRTEFLFYTHTDVFPMRKDLLEFLHSQLTPEKPIIGYGMSDRSWVTNLWKECVGHQCLMVNNNIMRELGVSWNMEQCYKLCNWIPGPTNGFPDAEVGFSLDYNRKSKIAGLRPAILLGTEVNFQRFVDENIDHCRGYTGYALYLDKYMVNRSEEWMQAALRAAKERIREWSKIT